jgi:4-amino-4-deoxy-L-arabinose transferase-like glycosyltransferase
MTIFPYSGIGLISLGTIFGGALLGMFAARTLPGHHLGSETRSAVSVSVAVVGTLSALVLGLLISTASNSFSARSHEVTAISVDIIRIDRTLRRYGSEAQAVRAGLHTYAMAKMQELFPQQGQALQSNTATASMLEALQNEILLLAPSDEVHRWLRSELLTLSEELSETRWLLAQQAGSSIPTPFLILLIFWLTIVFASFGLFAPPNGTAIAAVFLCSLAVSGGILMILEMDSPSTGVIRVSAEPMRHAMTEISS